MNQEIMRFPAFGGEAILLCRDVLDLEEKENYERAFALLSQERKKKVLFYKVRKPALLSLGAGLILREGLLSLGIDPDCKMIYGEQEKPYLEGGEAFFNLSHSGDKVLGIFSRQQEVGCDIQEIEKPRNKDALESRPKKEDRPEMIYRRFFHPEEVKYLDSLPEEERRKSFYGLWAMKEAYIKALGAGLSCPLDSFWLDYESCRVVQGEKLELEKKEIPGYALSWARVMR